MVKNKPNSLDEFLQSIDDFQKDLILFEQNINDFKSEPSNKIFKFLVGMQLLHKITLDIGYKFEELGRLERRTSVDIWDTPREILRRAFFKDEF